MPEVKAASREAIGSEEEDVLGLSVGSMAMSLTFTGCVPFRRLLRVGGIF